MRISRQFLRTIMACATGIALSSPALAADLTGAWVTDLQACDKVFATKGSTTSFRPDSDMSGSGFIVDGKRIRGRMASCTIKTTREDGPITHMLAGCATDIMLQTVQFSVKLVDDN